MSVKYLIRLDDACPTLYRNRWQLIEDVLDNAGVLPIVSVVADNKDPNLQHDIYCTNFWDTVRRWKSKGWSLGLHGETHELITSKYGLVPINKYSEFCGLPLEKQKEKIRRAVTIWTNNNVTPDVWIAPAHSFDNATLIALKEETTIRYISDGLSPFPYFHKNFIWVPQQLWHFRRLPFGVWTICLHPNVKTEEQIRSFKTILLRNREKFISLEDLASVKRSRSVVDILFSKAFEPLLRFKKLQIS